MRLYPSVKWACTELTYEREEEEEEVAEVEGDEAVATLKALQEYTTKKRERKNSPQRTMFFKLFRFIRIYIKCRKMSDQVHLWRKQGARRGGNDSSSADQHEAA